MNSISMELDIQRFADGGSGESSGESATVAQSQETGVEADNNTANVPAAEEQNDAEEVTLDSIFAKYPELKKEADKRTQKAVQGRVHQINKSMQSQTDLIDKLMVHHGVNSMEELSDRVDSSLREEFAIQNGVSEDIADEMIQLRVNNRRNAIMKENYEAEMRVQQQMRVWEDEAKKVQEFYPEFNLETEMQNPQFVNYLRNSNTEYHASMKQVYEMLHHDEMIQAAERRAADAYSKSMSQMHNRPNENGLGNQAAVNGQRDVSKLTKKERAELAQRAARGEKITF